MIIALFLSLSVSNTAFMLSHCTPLLSYPLFYSTSFLSNLLHIVSRLTEVFAWNDSSHKPSHFKLLIHHYLFPDQEYFSPPNYMRWSITESRGRSRIEVIGRNFWHIKNTLLAGFKKFKFDWWGLKIAKTDKSD